MHHVIFVEPLGDRLQRGTNTEHKKKKSNLIAASTEPANVFRICVIHWRLGNQLVFGRQERVHN